MRAGRPAAVRGALAIDTDSRRCREPRREPARPPRPATPRCPSSAIGGAAALARITTLQPRSYNEARTIGERYRDGVPVIMNLTELDDAAAKRLVDFAAGLAFALRGSIDKVTSRVFLLTPADVEVSADDARRLAQNAAASARIDGRVPRHPVRPLLPAVLLLAAAHRADRGGARTQLRPPVGAGGPSAVALELIFTATDPPVKLLRRVIPVVRIGGVGLDLSIMVLLLVVFILMNVAQPTPL